MTDRPLSRTRTRTRQRPLWRRWVRIPAADGGDRCSRDRGSSPVEFAIIALPMLLLGFSVLQAAVVYHARAVAMGAATQGVNVERGYQAAPGSGVSHANDFLDAAGAGLTNRTVTVERTDAGVRITVTGRAISILPGLAWRVSRTAQGPIERPTTP